MRFCQLKDIDMEQKTEDNLKRQSRLTALVIAGSTICWLSIQWIGSAIGIPGHYAILADLATLAAFFWALVNCFFLWRQRQDLKG